jgi:hypothetical protein
LPSHTFVTGAAEDGAANDYVISRFYMSNLRPYLLDYAGRLVARDEG